MNSVIELSRRAVVDRRGFVAASSAYALATAGLPDPVAVLWRARLTSDDKVRVGRGEDTALGTVHLRQDAVNDRRAHLYRLRGVPGVAELDERTSALE